MYAPSYDEDYLNLTAQGSLQSEKPSLGSSQVIKYILAFFLAQTYPDIVSLFLQGWITLGNKNRATAATGMNDKSSRSHSVFTIVLTQTKVRKVTFCEGEDSYLLER